jgi:hypothetical protein
VVGGGGGINPREERRGQRADFFCFVFFSFFFLFRFLFLLFRFLFLLFRSQLFLTGHDLAVREMAREEVVVGGDVLFFVDGGFRFF